MIHMSIGSSRIVIVGRAVAHGSQIIVAMNAAAKIRLSVSRASQKSSTLLWQRGSELVLLKLCDLLKWCDRDRY